MKSTLEKKKLLLKKIPLLQSFNCWHYLSHCCMHCITSSFRFHRKQLASTWMDLLQNTRRRINSLNTHAQAQVHPKAHIHKPHNSAVSLASIVSSSSPDWMPVLSPISLWLEGLPTPPLIDTWSTWPCPLAQTLMWISRECDSGARDTHWVPFCLTTCQQAFVLFSTQHDCRAAAWNLDHPHTVLYHMHLFLWCNTYVLLCNSALTPTNYVFSLVDFLSIPSVSLHYYLL